MFLTNIIKWILFLSLALPTLTFAAENPDELYRQGRYTEAEEAYAQFDMDHPKDIRYRYNRGCATYRNSDYEGAMAAFGSVLRRAKDDDMRFKAAYNSGNTAFKQGDFASSVAHYKQATIYNTENEDARHNLELALIELAKSKKNKPEKSESQKQKEQSQDGKKEEGSDQPPAQKDADQEQSQSQDQQQSADQSESERQAESEKEDDSDEGQKAEPPPAKDLSGEPGSPQALPQQDQKGDNARDSTNPAIDKKMAEALLDNIKEDRSRLLRFQVPREKRHGVQSGKDW